MAHTSPCAFGCDQFPCYEDKCPACRAAIDASEDAREARKEAMLREPPIGTYAFTARMLVECGIMTGDEADDWKDQMKEHDGPFSE
jgi:hypothetical protein